MLIVFAAYSLISCLQCWEVTAEIVEVVKSEVSAQLSAVQKEMVSHPMLEVGLNGVTIEALFLSLLKNDRLYRCFPSIDFLLFSGFGYCFIHKEFCYTLVFVSVEDVDMLRVWRC